MARKPTGKPRGRPRGQTWDDYNFSRVVEFLFETELARGRTYEEACQLVLNHPDFLEEARKAPWAKTDDAIQKRFQRAIAQTWDRRRRALHDESMEPLGPWDDGFSRSDTDPQVEAPADRIRVKFEKERGD